MKRPQIHCENCNGSGMVPINDELFSTLKAVGRGAMAGDVLKKLDAEISVNAVNNRLEHLRALGLLKRTRVGKFWRYKVETKFPATGGD